MQVTKCDVCYEVSRDTPYKVKCERTFSNWEFCPNCWKRFLKWIEERQKQAKCKPA